VGNAGRLMRNEDQRVVLMSEKGKDFTRILFRQSSTLLLFMTGLMMLTGRPVAAGDHFRAESLAKVAKQGQACLIRVPRPVSPKPIELEFQGRRSPAIFSEQSGTHEGLIGIDMAAQPSTYELKVIAKDGGSDLHLTRLSLKVEKVEFGVEKLTLPSSMVDLDKQTLVRVSQEEKLLTALFRTVREERLWKGAFICPVEGELSGAFGVSRIINGQRRSPHSGIDLRAKEGTPVVACAGGVVVLAQPLFFSGNSVILDHGWGFYSMYFHLSQVLVRDGEIVAKETRLGRVGSSGRSTGPHLHWGIRMNGARVDPLSLLKLEN
jgi:murein DD-endopeptidase MepM/ murein hydrolase activator NlpD